MKKFTLSFSGVLGSSIVPLLITLTTLPLLIGLIGLDRYGLLAIVWMVSGSISFIQFGIGPALIQRLNAARKTTTSASKISAPALLSSAFAVNGVTSIFAALIGGIGFVAYCTSFDVADGLIKRELLDSAPYVACAIGLGFWVSMLLSIQQADENFGIYSFAKFVNTSSAQLAPLAVAYLIGPRFDVLIAAIVASRLAVVIYLGFSIREHLRTMGFSIIRRKNISDLLRFGGWVSVLALMSPALVMLDRFIIGALYGATAVGTYAIAYNLCTRLFVVPTSLSNVLLPRLARLEGEAMSRTSHRGLRLTIALMTPILAGFIAFYELFVTWWMSPMIARSTLPLAAILSLGVFSAAIGQGPYTRLVGEGRVKIIAYWHAAQLPIYVIALGLTVPTFGLIAAASTWSLRTFCDGIGLLMIAKMRFDRLLLLAVCLLVTSVLGQLILENPSFRFIVSIGVLAVASILAAWVLIDLGGARLMRQFSSSKRADGNCV